MREAPRSTPSLGVSAKTYRGTHWSPWRPELDLTVGVRAVAPDHAPDGRRSSRTPSFERERPADDVADVEFADERIVKAHEQRHVARHFAEFALAAGVHPAGGRVTSKPSSASSHPNRALSSKQRPPQRRSTISRSRPITGGTGRHSWRYGGTSPKNTFRRRGPRPLASSRRRASEPSGAPSVPYGASASSSRVSGTCSVFRSL